MSEQGTQNKTLHQKIVESVEFKLKGTKCRYYIELKDGTVYTSGDIKVDDGKKSKRKGPYKHGAMAEIYRDKLANLKISDEIVFERDEYGDIPTKHFYHGVQSALCNRYGAGCSEGQYDETTGRVEFVLLQITIPSKPEPNQSETKGVENVV